MAYLVYKLTSPSHKSYIGYTNKPSVRIRFVEHCGAARRGSTFALHRAIQKYGIDAWNIEELAFFDDETLAKNEEIRLIKDCATLSPHGYNMTVGGDGFRGLARSEAHNLAISKAHMGHVTSEETKEKLRQYTGEKASFFGRKQSPEWHAKIKEIMTTNHPMSGVRGEVNARSKKYILTSPEGEVFRIKGLREFCRTNNLSYAMMARASRTAKLYLEWKVEFDCAA